MTQPHENDVAAVQRCQEAYQRIRQELGKVIIGQGEVIEQVLITILAQGHALLEGVPGLAKTLLVSSLAKSLHLSFKRIQFTPDLMPSDVTGTEVIQEDTVSRERAYKFLAGPIFAHTLLADVPATEATRKDPVPRERAYKSLAGPIFANMLLADEINRTPPKTQAAMLEAMQERQVSAGGQMHALPAPFFVLATQNPLEQEGTYPLPEAQLDRFLMEIDVDYPDRDAERRILFETTGAEETLAKASMNADALIPAQRLIRRLPVGD